MARNCYSVVCEVCIHKGDKKLFNKYKCNINKKPVKNSCYYLKCNGRSGYSLCKSCINYNNDKEE